MLVAGCKFTSDLICPFVEPIRKRDLLLVVPREQPDLYVIITLGLRRRFGSDDIP